MGNLNGTAYFTVKVPEKMTYSSFPTPTEITGKVLYQLSKPCSGRFSHSLMKKPVPLEAIHSDVFFMYVNEKRARLHAF